MKIALAIASVALTLLVAECSLAVFVPQELSIFAHTRDGLITHAPSIELYSPRFDQILRTNAWGMRDRPHPLEKPPGTFRILVLGDSFMEALQVGYEESLPSLLEGRLSELTGRDIEVINGSVSGWGTDDQLSYLDRYGMRFQPDLVLVAMTMHNDVSDNLALEHHDFRDGRIVERPRVESSGVEWARIRARDFIANHSQLYGVFRGVKAALGNRAGANLLNAHVASLIRREPHERTAAGWEMTRQLLERTRDVAGDGGAETAVFVVPLFIQVSEERRQGFLTAQGLGTADIDIDQPQRTVLQWGASEAVEVIDLVPRFRAAARNGRSFYLAGDGHWNREGHALAAEIVAREIVGRDLVGQETAQPSH